MIAILFPLIQGCSGKNKVDDPETKEAALNQEVVDEARMKEMIKEAENKAASDSNLSDSESAAELSNNTDLLSDSGVRIFTEERSATQKGAKVNITWPRTLSVLEADDVLVVVEVQNFELGIQTPSSRADELSNSVNGQHVHLIVDNKPYKAIYDPGKPVNIGKLAPGPHSIFAFPGRSYHESLKNHGASDLLNFYIAGSTGRFEVNDNTPAVFYNRPKGEYKGLAAKKIMFDFYLHNIKLSEGGVHAKYTVTKKGSAVEEYSIILTEWKPAFITGLTSGTYTVKIELVDSVGRIIKNVAYNGTSREIKIVSE